MVLLYHFQTLPLNLKFHRTHKISYGEILAIWTIERSRKGKKKNLRQKITKTFRFYQYFWFFSNHIKYLFLVIWHWSMRVKCVDFGQMCGKCALLKYKN